MNESSARREALRIIRTMIINCTLPKNYDDDAADLIQFALDDYAEMLDEEIGDDGMAVIEYG